MIIILLSIREKKMTNLNKRINQVLARAESKLQNDFYVHLYYYNN